MSAVVGADPRGGWAADERVIEHWRLRDDGTVARWDWRRGRRWKDRRHYVEVHFPGQALPRFDTVRYVDGLTHGIYVPFDVARWRDADHRNALAQRALQRFGTP